MKEFEKTTLHDLKKKLEHLKNLGYTRIISISGIDSGPNIDIVYSFAKGKRLVNIKTAVKKSRPELSTVTDIYPGAILYERELSEMLGVRVKGNKFDRLFLPEDWPKGNYPLRKEAL